MSLVTVSLDHMSPLLKLHFDTTCQEVLASRFYFSNLYQIGVSTSDEDSLVRHKYNSQSTIYYTGSIRAEGALTEVGRHHKVESRALCYQPHVRVSIDL